jgi:tight adherence protein B
VTAVAIASAAMAAALLVGPVARVADGVARPPRPVVAAGLAAVLIGLAVFLVPGSSALAAIAAAVGIAVATLVRRRWRRRDAHVARARVLETCELIAAELSVGQPPGQALGHAADAWPPLRPVAEAFALGGDVPNALRALGRTPGAGDLRLLAASWSVAHRTGHGLVDAVQRCADSIRAAQGSRRLVEGELSSARATVRLVAGLPLLALLMGSGAGGDPFGFLLGHPLGLACLAGGLAFGFAGLWWIEAIAADVDSA